MYNLFRLTETLRPETFDEMPVRELAVVLYRSPDARASFLGDLHELPNIVKTPVIRRLEDRFDIPGDGALFSLYYLEKWTNQEIAAQIALNVAAVRVALQDWKFPERTDFHFRFYALERWLERRRKMIQTPPWKLVYPVLPAEIFPLLPEDLQAVLRYHQWQLPISETLYDSLQRRAIQELDREVKLRYLNQIIRQSLPGN